MQSQTRLWVAAKVLASRPGRGATERAVPTPSSGDGGQLAWARFRRVVMVEDSRDADGADPGFSNSASTTTGP